MRLLTLILPLLITLASCGPAGDREAEQAAPQEAAVQLPDTTAEAVWGYLETQDYRSWPLWPGKGKLYPGTEPHGMLLTTYLDPVALDAVTNKAGALPAGSFVVKENYAPDSTLAAVTVMYKAGGYNPEHNNWFWMKRLTDGTVEASGRVVMCQGCHGAMADNDYIMTGPLK